MEAYEEPNPPQKRAKADSAPQNTGDLDSSYFPSDNDSSDGQIYRLVHPSEVIAHSTIHNDTENGKKRKVSSAENSLNTLRLAEDTRFYYAHLHAGGKLHLLRTPVPLVSYRHRCGMSQSSNTSRKLLLKLRARAWEDLIYHNSKSNNADNTQWSNGFAIWGAGRDGKDFLKALSPEVVSKVICFVDVDRKKIETVKWYDNPVLLGGRRIPILHFSSLARDQTRDQAMVAPTFGRIDKKRCGKDTFNVVPKQQLTLGCNKIEKASSMAKSKHKKTKASSGKSIDPEVLCQLPVVVCVAMYRTNGALERNVASIGRVEGKDLWHII